MNDGVIWFIIFFISIIIGFIIYPHMINNNTKSFCLDLKDLDYNAYIKTSNVFLFENCYIDNKEITYEDYRQIKLYHIIQLER